MAPLVIIPTHTTSSTPRPHIIYNVQVIENGSVTTVNRRYSEFVALHETLKDTFTLPPKRLLTTTFKLSAWVDDTLITERKAGLAVYLNCLISDPQYWGSGALNDFLTPGKAFGVQGANAEDTLPSTLDRKATMSMVGTFGDGAEPQAPGNIAAAYYPDWSAGSNPPEKIDFSKFDILFFAFAMPSSSSDLDWNSSSRAIMQRLVKAARASGKGTKIVLSVGGWGGSKFFSQACSNAANRTKFANSMVSAVNQYGLDGLDIDWEYPNSAGDGNPHGPNDAANLLSLFKLLRSKLPTPKIISAAVAHLPWLGANGRPLTDVSAYAAVMDYVNIMNYDVWGASANPGPNAPLGDLCGTSKQPQANAQAALKQWRNAGFPANKQLLGLALYGYVSRSTKKVLSGSIEPSSDMLIIDENVETTFAGEARTTFVNAAHPGRAAENSEAEGNGDGLSIAEAVSEPGDVRIAANLQSFWGRQIPFEDIVRSGALVKRSDGSYGEGGGFTMGWDDCSNTPYLFNVAQQTVVSYDDTWSLRDKAKFAKDNGMAGCFTWSLDQDDGLTLQNAIRKALGK